MQACHLCLGTCAPGLAVNLEDCAFFTGRKGPSEKDSSETVNTSIYILLFYCKLEQRYLVLWLAPHPLGLFSLKQPFCSQTAILKHEKGFWDRKCSLFANSSWLFISSLRIKGLRCITDTSKQINVLWFFSPSSGRGGTSTAAKSPSWLETAL